MPADLIPSRAYPEDAALLQRLGLEWRGGWGQAWTRLGTTLAGHSPTRCRVTIEVAAWPAHFWRFTLNGAGDDTFRDYVISTGSGKLTDYWPLIEQLAEGMVVVESAELSS